MENNNIIYELIGLDKLKDDFLNGFNRFQETNNILYKESDDKYIIKEEHFIDEWNANKKAAVIQSLQSCIKNGGFVIGAYDNEYLIGFVNVEGKVFGKNNEYQELPIYMFQRNIEAVG